VSELLIMTSLLFQVVAMIIEATFHFFGNEHTIRNSFVFLLSVVQINETKNLMASSF